MKKWLVSLAAVMALAGCADNTAGVRVDSLTQNVFFGDKVLGSRLQVEARLNQATLTGTRSTHQFLT